MNVDLSRKLVRSEAWISWNRYTAHDSNGRDCRIENAEIQAEHYMGAEESFKAVIDIVTTDDANE